MQQRQPWLPSACNLCKYRWTLYNYSCQTGFTGNGRLRQGNKSPRSILLVFSVTPFKIDQNKNQNRSIDKVQNLGNKRRYIYKDPRQDSGQRNISYTRYPKKCFHKINRGLYGDAMLVSILMGINMADGNQQKHLLLSLPQDREFILRGTLKTACVSFAIVNIVSRTMNNWQQNAPWSLAAKSIMPGNAKCSMTSLADTNHIFIERFMKHRIL